MSLMTVKLLRDLRAAWPRMLMMVIAIAVSLTVFGGILFAWSAINRETSSAYLGTEPASATIRFGPGIDAQEMAAIAAEVRNKPGVVEATGRTQFTSDIDVNGNPRDIPLQLFVAAPDDPMRMATFEVEQGGWPPRRAKSSLDATPCPDLPGDLAAGLALPVLMALIPLIKTSRTTVRAAIDHSGLGASPRIGAGMLAWLGRIPRLDRGLLMALRNTIRRPARFLLSVGLLAMAGMMFVAGMSARDSDQAVAEQATERLRWDVTVRLGNSVSVDALAPAMQQVPGVTRVEGWTIA